MWAMPPQWCDLIRRILTNGEPEVFSVAALKMTAVSRWCCYGGGLPADTLAGLQGEYFEPGSADLWPEDGNLRRCDGLAFELRLALATGGYYPVPLVLLREALTQEGIEVRIHDVDQCDESGPRSELLFTGFQNGHLEALLGQEQVVPQLQILEATRELRNYLHARAPHLQSIVDTECLVV